MMQKRESTGWTLAGALTIAVGILSFIVYHDRFEPKGESEAVGLGLLITLKNSMRGRLSSYERVPEEQLTPFEKDMKTVIEYDLKDIEDAQEALTNE